MAAHKYGYESGVCWCGCCHNEVCECPKCNLRKQLTVAQTDAKAWAKSACNLQVEVERLQIDQGMGVQLNSDLHARIEELKTSKAVVVDALDNRGTHITKLEGLLREAKKYTATDLLRRIDAALGKGDEQ